MKTFTQCRKGYSPEEVDTYIQELEKKISRQAAELNAFKEKEMAINKSVIDAQLLAEEIENQARTKAGELRQESLKDLEDVKEKVLTLHEKLVSFQSEYARILQQYLVSLRSEDMKALFADLETFMKKLDMEVPSQEEPAVELTDLGMGE